MSQMQLSDSIFSQFYIPLFLFVPSVFKLSVCTLVLKSLFIYFSAPIAFSLSFSSTSWFGAYNHIVPPKFPIWEQHRYGHFCSTCCRDCSCFSWGHVLAQHHGKPDASLNSVELDLIKAVCAEDQDGKAELALKGKSRPKKRIDPRFSHEDIWITNTNNSQSFRAQGTSMPVRVKKEIQAKIPS